MATADIRTRGGIVKIGSDWVGKSIAGVKIKGEGNDVVLDLSDVYNTTEKGVYPIMLASYELVCSTYPDPEVGRAVRAFLQATVTTGQADLNPIGYVPLPPNFQSRVATAVNAIS